MPVMVVVLLNFGDLILDLTKAAALQLNTLPIMAAILLV